MLFSIILPIRNQADQMEIAKKYFGVLKKLGQSFEIIVVVNDSRDESYKKFQSLSGPNVRVFKLKKRGWGRAVKFGISKARGRFICYTNSARTNPQDLIKILKFSLTNPNCLVKANRIIRAGNFRKLGSTLYNLEFRFLFKVPSWDINGTPKVFPRSLLKEAKLRSDGDLLDAELLYKCFKKDINILGISTHNNRRISGKSSTNLVSALKMYFGLIKHRVNGFYDK